MTIGQLLRETREKKNLSVGQLALYSGVSRPYLYEIENGVKCPSPKILQKLAKTLGVPHDRLVEVSIRTKHQNAAH